MHQKFEEETGSDQSLKKKLEVIKLWNIPGENVKLFTSQFLQTCIDLGRIVPKQCSIHSQ